MKRYLFLSSVFVSAILTTMQLTQVACLAQFAPIPPGIGESGSPVSKLPEAGDGPRNYAFSGLAAACLESKDLELALFALNHLEKSRPHDPRISVKLLAYGQVGRASLPLAISPVTYFGKVAGKPTQLSGMSVVGVNSGILGYEVLKEQIIISIDGVPTPTTTDWMIAMERAKALDRKSVVCEITTGLGELIRMAEVYLEDDTVLRSMSPEK